MISEPTTDTSNQQMQTHWLQ